MKPIIRLSIAAALFLTAFSSSVLADGVTPPCLPGHKCAVVKWDGVTPPCLPGHKCKL